MLQTLFSVTFSHLTLPFLFISFLLLLLFSSVANQCFIIKFVGRNTEKRRKKTVNESIIHIFCQYFVLPCRISSGLLYDSYVFIYIHLYSFIFIYIHLYSFIFIYIHLYSFIFIYIHLYSFIFIYIHSFIS